MSGPKNSSRSATIPVRDPSLPLSSNKHLLRWIQKMFTLTEPDSSIGWTVPRRKTTRSANRWSKEALSLTLTRNFGRGAIMPSPKRDASHFPCELVPQGGGRQISLARLRRKHARPQVDRGARSRPCTRQGGRRRLAASLRRYHLGWTGFSKREIRGAPAPGPHAWRREVIGHEELFLDLHDHLPKELIYERELLICRL